MLSKPCFLIRYILILSLCFGSIIGVRAQSLSQSTSDADIKAVLILNFIRYITPVIRKSSDTITLGKYGNEKTMLQSLKKIEFQKVRGKIIKLVDLNRNSDLTRYDAIYVFKENNFDIWRIFKNIKNLPIILITDNYTDQREVMINFTQPNDTKIQFEINTKNLRDASLEVSPKLLLLGGTELDIRELYNETEKSLTFEKVKTDQYERELELKKTEVNMLNKQQNNFYVRIDSLNSIIIFQIENILKQKSNMDSMNAQVGLLSETVKQRQRIIDSYNISITGKNLLIADLDVQLKEKQQNLENTNVQFNQLEKEIDWKENMLQKQNLKITSQKTIIIVGLAFVILLTVYLMLVYKSYRNKQIQNIELERRNAKINNQKAQIQQQTENLQQAILEMETQKNRAQGTLKKLKDTQSQLVVAEKMASLGQLTAGIAHEINNPINYISSSIEGLRYVLSDMKHLLTEYDKISVINSNENIVQLKKEFEYDELIKGFDDLTANIKLGVDKTKEIVNSLRMFSRVDENSYTLVNINQSIESVLVLIGKQHGDRITILKEYGNIPEIECNAGQIFQVFLNVIVNAIHSIKNEGTITISTAICNKMDKKLVEIVISDTGIGMTKPVMEKIFEPFFTTKEAGQGTGLGLSITYSIINKIGGYIEVESEVNRGTAFNIYLPMK